eukprot:gene1566-12151_t
MSSADLDALSGDISAKLARSVHDLVSAEGWVQSEAAMKEASTVATNRLHRGLRWAMLYQDNTKWVNKPDDEFGNVATWAQRELGKEIDNVQLTLVFWGVTLKASAMFLKCLQAIGVKADVASVVSGMCSSILRDSLIESRLAGNMHMNADSQNPFAVLLRTTHPKHVFTEQPKPFVTPVTLSGLGGDLASLNNVYTYDSMIAGRPCYKELKAVEDAAAVLHYIYWWPEFTRWYVGPTPGSSNILVYVDGVAGGDGVPDQRNGLWTAWNGADWLKMKDVNCISLNTKIFKAAPKPSAIEMDTST